MKRMNQTHRGFTLIELMVSVSIMVILTIIGVVAYSSVNKRSRDVKRKGDLEQIRSALEMYRSDITSYPNLGSGFMPASGLSSTLVSTYLPAIPSDPKTPTNDYYYQGIQTGGVYSSYCLCGKLETIVTTQSTCTVSLSGNCNYGLKSP